ncbi:MAG: c-type cytochrome [Cellulophaga sp.]
MRTGFYFLLCVLLGACKPTYEETIVSLDDYKLEKGFKLKVIAAEPLLKAPIALDFDAKGRIWVVEMPGFMSNIDGTGEDNPTGTIKILEDLDKDGVMDHAKIFLDSLVLPRAIAMVYGGVLYAEPPNLYFIEIEDDKPVNRVLVDSIYALEGNPEHQPNGLTLNIDNWIYNAKSHFRYQRKNGKWLKEPTTYRGQWGIAHDNFGRLYYNDNSRQLLGDYILPNRLVRNAYLQPRKGVNQLLTKDQRVYPLHVASVNRGYDNTTLNKDSVLINVTAACAPLVYRGGAFPEGYSENVFVCIPEGNLIKRNILSFNTDNITAEQAWQEKEFLASTDEGFRPVNLSNGPEGSLYVVDMHRGILGHHAYLSPYLKKKIVEKQLDTIVNKGRILKIEKEGILPSVLPDFDALSTSELVNLLFHKNGWIRDYAQHYIIYKKKKGVIPELKNLVVEKNTNPLAKIHALYALKGLEALSFSVLNEVAQSDNSKVVVHAIVLLEDFVTSENIAPIKKTFDDLLERKDATIDLYLSTSIGVWTVLSKEHFLPALFVLANRYEDKGIYQEAIVSGSNNITEEVLLELKEIPNRVANNLDTLLIKTIENKVLDRKNSIYTRTGLTEDTRTVGAKLFRNICAACHGLGGEGIYGLAPPLQKSEFITESVERLALIILHGVKGPIVVNGKAYEMNLAMPGLLSNETLSDKDISDIISYVSNAFDPKPKHIRASRIKELRELKPKEGLEFTAKELLVY